MRHIRNIRRNYDFSDMSQIMYELFRDDYKFLGAMQATTNPMIVKDIKFNCVEYTSQWHRRLGQIRGAVNVATMNTHLDSPVDEKGGSRSTHIALVKNTGLYTNVNRFGKQVKGHTEEPLWLQEDQVLDIPITLRAKGSDRDTPWGQTVTSGNSIDVNATFRIRQKEDGGGVDGITKNSDGDLQVNVEIQQIHGYDSTRTNFPKANWDITIKANQWWQVIGTALPEASDNVYGWTDEVSTRQSWVQIIRNGTPLFSNTVLAMETKFREGGEFNHAVKQLMRVHTQDKALLAWFGQGCYRETFSRGNVQRRRQTWGWIPYMLNWGDKDPETNDITTFNLKDTSVEDIRWMLHNFVNPDKGITPKSNKMYISRKMIGWMKTLESKSSFANNGSGLIYNTASTIPGSRVMYETGNRFAPTPQDGKYMIDTDWGSIECVVEHLFRGSYEMIGAIPNHENMQYVYLGGNGVRRHDMYLRQIQKVGQDSRLDNILSEIGFKFVLPETHKVIKFTDNA